ncbi:NAD(P)/FAD-dependent oxidoreductase [Aromatoleum petrolei]|uniref:Ferredoxin reductase n=1 Tax=Aromatoleum petrolei TaxID=76116 RepID=A0ABX1MP40_9RHOO|nr:FAD-dependent oxidoreductase [Aromatoleum petrolei]NMF89708.1 ferredoxin reductase [Aromatoleum petrolei]QTQ37349.1 Putative ferredoxin reductase [Aromatoleum petrolei]
MSIDSRIVIIGAGHAGGTLAAVLRDQGHAGPITLIGEETHPPYQRPPLSKAFLKGSAEIPSLLLKNADFYRANDIALRLGQRVEAIDRGARSVTLDDGSVLPYDFLVIATGARPRRLPIPGAELANILTLRSIADGERLRDVLQPGRRLAVVGGGYVGLEVAASARALGLDVTVIEREARLLARVASEPLARFYERHHTQQGVHIVCDAQAARFEGTDAVEALCLADGRRIPCDVAIVGVGAQPNDELARAAGLQCENGIVVDQDARSSDPAIFAIGDLSWRPMPLYGNRMFRLESVPNALEQARLATCAILGKARPAPEVPWFWSDQYELKLQIAGVPFDADRQVLRGNPDQGKFAVYHLWGERVVAVEALNSPLDFIAGKQFIAAASAVSAERLADPSVKARDAVLVPA